MNTQHTEKGQLKLSAEGSMRRKALKQGYEWVATVNPNTGESSAYRRPVGEVCHVRATNEVVTLWADLTPYERRRLRKERAKGQTERAMNVLQKILESEVDLAEAQEGLKKARECADLRAMQYYISEVEHLTARLQKLRGTQPEPQSLKPAKPKRRKTGRVFTPLHNGNTAVMVENRIVQVRTPEQISKDKQTYLANQHQQELVDKANYIADLQGYRRGSRGHVIASIEAYNDLVMIERLQAFESTIEQYVDELDQHERIQHFGGITD